MFWYFLSGKSLLHKSSVKAHHAKLAFEDASKDMHHIMQSLRHLTTLLEENVPKPLARNTYRTTKTFARYALLLKREAEKLKKEIAQLEHKAKKR